MPVRILHIVTYMGRGGLETLIMNVFRGIDRECVQFDFLVHRDFRADYDDEIEALGGRIYRLPRLNPMNPAYYKALDGFFRDHPEYRIVHCHLDCMSAIPLAAAKKQGVPVRIAHSHNASQDRNWKYAIKRHYMKKIPAHVSHLFACSEEAGRWMFPGEKFTVVKNGIRTEDFVYDPAARQQIRQALGLRSELVMGHVGRFAPQKNHDFLVDIFAAVHRQCANVVLLLVGEGPLEEQIRDKVHSLGLEQSVRFLGVHSDVNRLYQAMDVFIMPSQYEGLGIAAVEAQAAGLKCLLSDDVPSCVKITEDVEFLPLSAGEERWAEEILSDRKTARCNRQDAVAMAGYDIRTTARWLQKFYLEQEEARYV